MIVHLTTLLSCLAVFLVVPVGVDSFEAPKRLVFAALAVLLSLAGRCRRQLPCSLLAVLPVLFWMILRAWVNGFPAYGLVPLAIWAIPFVVFASSAIHSKALRSGHLLSAIAYAGVFEAVVMILQRYGLDPFFASTTSQIDYLPGRMVGTIGYQNQAAEFLGIAFFCLSAAKGKAPLKVFSALTIVIALAMTANRGALLGLLFASVVAAVIAISRRKGASKIVVAAIFVLSSAVFALFAASELKERMVELTHVNKSQAVQSRRWMARVAVDIFRDDPVFGAGPGEYAFQYVDRLGGALPGVERRRAVSDIVYAREAHCDALQFATEFGSVGVLLLLAFLASLLVSMLRLASTGDEHDGQVAFAAAMSLAFLAVCSCFNFTFQTPLGGGFAGLLAGIAVEGKREVDASKHAWIVWCPALVSLYVLFAAVAENVDNMLDRNRLAASVLSGRPLPARASGRTISEVAAFVDVAGHPEAAVPLFGRALDTYVSPTLLMNYGHSLASMGCFNDAAIVYKRLERCGLQNCEAMKNLSIVLERSGRVRESVEVERSRFAAYARDFTDGEVFRYASLLVRIGDFDAALRIVGDFQRRCDRHNPNGWKAEWDNLCGVVWMKKGVLDVAREFFESALEKNPQLKSAQKNLDTLNGLRK